MFDKFSIWWENADRGSQVCVILGVVMLLFDLWAGLFLLRFL